MYFGQDDRVSWLGDRVTSHIQILHSTLKIRTPKVQAAVGGYFTSYDTLPSFPFPREKRVRKDAKRERIAPTIDIGRHYAALFDAKTKPPNDATKRIVNEEGAGGSQHRGTAAAAAAAAAAANDGDRAAYFAQDSSQGSRARFRDSNRRRRRKGGRNKDSSNAAGVDPSSGGAGNRGGRADVAMHNYLDEKIHSHEMRRVDKHGSDEESASEPSTGAVVVKGAAQRDALAMTGREAEPTSLRGGRVTADGGWAGCSKRRGSENGNEQVRPGWVDAEGGGNGCAGREKGARQRQERPPNDCGESCCSSDYGEESFEPTSDESQAGRPMVGIDEAVSLASRRHAGGAGDVTGDDHGRQEESACLDRGSAAEETFSEEGADAAALRIESCWRGFRGRCTARMALRSALLTALRNIGGGKISKVCAWMKIQATPEYHPMFAPHSAPSPLPAC